MVCSPRAGFGLAGSSKLSLRRASKSTTSSTSISLSGNPHFIAWAVRRKLVASRFRNSFTRSVSSRVDYNISAQTHRRHRSDFHPTTEAIRAADRPASPSLPPAVQGRPGAGPPRRCRLRGNRQSRHANPERGILQASEAPPTRIRRTANPAASGAFGHLWMLTRSTGTVA